MTETIIKIFNDNEVTNEDYENALTYINNVNINKYDSNVVMLLYIKAKCLFYLYKEEDAYISILHCIHFFNKNLYDNIINEDKIYALYIDICAHLNKHDEIIKMLSHHHFNINDLEVYKRLSYWIYNSYFGYMSEPYISNRRYFLDKYNKLKIKFDGSYNIIRNYSEMMQDMFVLSILNGKKNGTYLEFGAAEYDKNNNTYLLETLYDWTGISIDYNEYFVNEFNAHRKNNCIYGNALEIDYNDDFFSNITNTNRIDYLQLDLDPNTITLEVLKKLPLDKIRFSVITFEHDRYHTDDNVRNESRQIFANNNYLLVGKDICCNLYMPFEDWYVDKTLLESDNRIIDNVNILFKKDNYSGDVNKIFYNS